MRGAVGAERGFGLVSDRPDGIGFPCEVGQFTASVVANAKTELRRLDPSYVQLIDEFAAATRAGIEHPRWDPRRPPEPAARLSKEWTDLLEALWDFDQHVHLVLTALTAFAEVGDSHDSESEGHLLTYHAFNWNVWMQACVEKASICIKRVIRRSDLPKTVKRRLIQEHTAEMDTMQKNMERARDPLVHGGPGTVVGALTEDGHWEPTVANSITPAESLHNYLTAYAPGKREEWHRVLTARTRRMFQAIGLHLEQTIDDVGWRREPTETTSR